MGKLVDGQWTSEDVNPETESGEFIRQTQKFNAIISKDGEFKPETDRYHLYVSHACPWAHRTLIAREMKGLKSIISLSVVNPDMMEDGWTFDENFSGVVRDQVFGKHYLREIYTEVDPRFTGKVTVPVLLDKKLKKIVNNESAGILRIFNEAFNDLTGNKVDLYPKSLRSEIDALNDDIYENINNGVYKCGFARTQEAYDKHITPLFDCLARVEDRLEGKSYLFGEQLTEADIRLFTTLVRFDVVYYLHFKCNFKMIRDFKNLYRYLEHLYSIEEFKSTTRFDHIKRHYYYSHPTINPFRIIPYGPEIKLHGTEEFLGSHEWTY